MRRSLGSLFQTAFVTAVVLLGLTGCQRSFDDPASAQCARPAVGFEQPVDLGTHKEVVVHFSCAGAMLTGTLYLPERESRHRRWCGSWAASRPPG